MWNVIDFVSCAATLVVPSGQRIAEVFHKFLLFQLIVLDNHQLEFLLQLLNRNLHTCLGLLYSKPFILEVGLNFMVVPKFRNVLVDFINPSFISVYTVRNFFSGFVPIKHEPNFIQDLFQKLN